jgi:hypothetical protein
VGGCGDEVSARSGGAARDCHSDCCGTAEAVPLSKAVRARLEWPPLAR